MDWVCWQAVWNAGQEGGKYAKFAQMITDGVIPSGVLSTLFLRGNEDHFRS